MSAAFGAWQALQCELLPLDFRFQADRMGSLPDCSVGGETQWALWDLGYVTVAAEG